MNLLAIVGAFILISGGAMIRVYATYDRLHPPLLHPKNYLFGGIVGIITGSIILAITAPAVI